MISNNHYRPPNHSFWQGRTDIPAHSAFFQIIQLHNLLTEKILIPNKKTFAFLGFSCDTGIQRNFGRVGAAEGPKAIRTALAKLPVLKTNFQCFDVGDIVCEDGDLEAAQHALSEVIAELLGKKIIPIVLGGGHEISFGHYLGIQKTHANKNLGIINFDAHLDMRPILTDKKGSSGTPFLQIAEMHEKTSARFDYNCVGIQHAGNIREIIENAKKYHVKIIWADDLHLGLAEKCIDFIDRIIDKNEIIYLTLCLDVFAGAFAPGVSAPQPLGLFPWHVIPLIRQLTASGKVISFDVAELSPQYDIDHLTAKLAATLIFEFIHHHNECPRQW